MSTRTRYTLALPLLISLAISACGGKNDSSNPTSPPAKVASLSSLSASSNSTAASSSQGPDTQGPVISLHYPPLYSTTQDTHITLRGTAWDQTGISQLQANGETVTTSNQFQDWQITLNNLKPGTTSITLTAQDTLGQAATPITLNIQQGSGFQSPQLSQLDETRNQLYVYDAIQKAILAINLATGEKSLLSPAADIPFNNPQDMVLDPIQQRLILCDQKYPTADTLQSSLVSVNLTNGQRSLIKQGPEIKLTGSDASPSQALRLPSKLALDAAQQQLYILDLAGIKNTDNTTSFSLTRLNLATSQETLISSLSQPNATLPPRSVKRLRLDAANNRLLYLTDTGANSAGLFALNLANGERSLISGFAEAANASSTSSTASSSSSSSSSSLVAITSASASPPSTLFAAAADFVYHNNSAWVFTNSHYVNDTTTETIGQVIQVDLATGTRQNLAASASPEYTTRHITQVSLNAEGTLAYLVDDSLDAVIALNLSTQKKTLISSHAPLNANTRLRPLKPSALALSANQQQLYISDTSLGEILNYNLTTGTTQSLTQFGVTNPLDRHYTQVKDIALDAANNRLITLAHYIHPLVDDNGKPSLDTNNNPINTLSLGLFSVSLTDGSSQVISGYRTPNTADQPSFNLAEKLTLDPTRQFALVYDAAATYNGLRLPSLIMVDLKTGFRSGSPSSYAFSGLAYSRTKDLFVMLDSFNRELLALTPNQDATQINIFSLNNNKIQTTDLLYLPKAIAVDNLRNRVILVDNHQDRVFSVDFSSGQRTLITSNTSPSTRNPFYQINAIALDETRNLLYLYDSAINAFLALDLTNGQRVYITP